MGKVVQLDGKGFDLPMKVFSNPGIFIGAVRKIMMHTEYPSFKSTYRIKRLGDELEKELKTYLHTISGLKNTLSEEELNTKATELHESTVHIKWDKISSEEIAKISFSPAELGIVEHLADLGGLA